ncbi:MAG: DUF2911 domain-containing protein [Cyclobacteriaceae bacterium]
MLKKIMLSLGVLIVLIAAAYLYLDNRNRTLSPRGEASLSNGELQVDLTYSRPSIRNRKPFGDETEESIQKYGQYWRLGANESTEITFNKDVLIVDQAIKAGTYRMYAIPGEQYFEIRLNTELGTWGAFEPDTALDVMSVMIPVNSGEHTEQFTITTEPLYDTGVKLNIAWGSIQMNLPINPQ